MISFLEESLLSNFPILTTLLIFLCNEDENCLKCCGFTWHRTITNMRRHSFGGVPILCSLANVQFSSHDIRRFVLSRVYNQPRVPLNLLPPVVVASSSAVAVAAPFIASLLSPSSSSSPAAAISTATSIKVASYKTADAETATDRSLVHSRVTFNYYLKSFIDKGNNLMADIGWGLYAGITIAKKSMVMIYYGEILSTRETKKRQEVYDPQQLNYILTVREHFNSGSILRTNIDATHVGGIARFVNHSCNPNMKLVVYRENNSSLDTRNLIGIPIFVASRVIHPGEQVNSYIRCINALNCWANYLCLRGWVYVFYVRNTDKIMKPFSML
jgi:hypothetical protein